MAQYIFAADGMDFTIPAADTDAAWLAAVQFLIAQGASGTLLNLTLQDVRPI